ncbi:MAG: type II toxin-antitoxin system VapC family toxin [Actinobacteria bacterium]|nr:type II toxin-antitoxin system VapC family toxin [Actinomycetota bacterium]
MIICDSGPLVAAAIKDDAFHRESVDLLTSLHLTGEEILVPATVAAEVGYMLGRGGHPEREAGFLGSLADGTLTPVELTAADYRRAGDLVLHYADLPLGTTDATVVALCERLNLREVAILDRRHFTVVRPHHVGALHLLP